MLTNFASMNVRDKPIQRQIMSSHRSVMQQFYRFWVMEAEKRREKKFSKCWSNQKTSTKVKEKKSLEEIYKTRLSVRSAYRIALKQYAGNDSVIAPQFKTWFYIYRNNTIEDDFRKILIDDYLVEIKDIDRYDNNFDSLNTPDSSSSNSQDLLSFEDFDTETTNSGAEDVETSTQVEFTANFDGEEIKEDKNSKFDRHVDDSQYVEAPEIRKKIKEESQETKRLNAKIEKLSSGPEKITLPIKKYMEDSMEIMEATENRNFESRVSNKNMSKSYRELTK